MSNTKLSQNENSNSNDAMGRSLSSARFQVAKVSQIDNESDLTLGKNASVSSGTYSN